MKVAILGAGKFLCDELMSKSKNIEIVAFIDNFLSGEYKNIKIYKPDEILNNKDIEAVYIAVGAQKALKTAINTIRQYGIDNIYMMHDIVGKCKLSIFDEEGKFINYRMRKLVFSNEKPLLHYFEVPITDKCNLNCKGCLFASNLSCDRGHVPLERLGKDASRMAELFIDVPWIRILGGEPLMHPDIIEILEFYRKMFPTTEIDLCTNGLLIPKMNDIFWKCVIDNRISIYVSGYKPTYSMLDKIDMILKDKGIPYAILKRDKFNKYYTLEANNDELESYEKCMASGCYEVYRGKISTCSGIIAFLSTSQYNRNRIIRMD